MSFAAPSFAQPGIRPQMPQQPKNARHTYQSRYDQYQQPQQHPSTPQGYHPQYKLHQPPLQRPGISVGKMLDDWVDPKLARIEKDVDDKVDGVTNAMDKARRIMEAMGQNIEALRQEIVCVTQKIDTMDHKLTSAMTTAETELSNTSRTSEARLNELKTILEHREEFMISRSEVNTILQKHNGQEAQCYDLIQRRYVPRIKYGPEGQSGKDHSCSTPLTDHNREPS